MILSMRLQVESVPLLSFSSLLFKHSNFSTDIDREISQKQ